MNKIVILEGPDGGGKTTLARHLEQYYGFKYVHTGPPSGQDLLEEYGYQLWRATYDDQPVVFDRLYLGERVYGPVLRGYDNLGEYGHKLMRRLTRGQDVYEVICLPPIDVCRENWRGRYGELVANGAHFNEIYDRYQAYARTPGYAVWDYTTIRLEITAEILKSAFTQFTSLPLDAVGSPTASFFFIGDKANQRRLDLPFFARGGRNSSEFFNECLAQAGYGESEIMLSNAYHIDRTVRHFAPVREDIQVVALGDNAASVLRAQKIRFVQIPHPAYWKRFHYYHVGPYVDQLAEIRTNYYQEQQRARTVPTQGDPVS